MVCNYEWLSFVIKYSSFLTSFVIPYSGLIPIIKTDELKRWVEKNLKNLESLFRKETYLATTGDSSRSASIFHLTPAPVSFLVSLKTSIFTLSSVKFPFYFLRELKLKGMLKCVKQMYSELYKSILDSNSLLWTFPNKLLFRALKVAKAWVLACLNASSLHTHLWKIAYRFYFT